MKQAQPPKTQEGVEKTPAFLDLIEEGPEVPVEGSEPERRKRNSRSKKKNGSIAVKIPELIYRQFREISEDQDSPMLWLLTRALNQWLQAYRITRHEEIIVLTRQMEEIKRKLLMVARIHLDIEPNSGKQMSERSLMEVLRDA